jgi:hypothetical protein
MAHPRHSLEGLHSRMLQEEASRPHRWGDSPHLTADSLHQGALPLEAIRPVTPLATALLPVLLASHHLIQVAQQCQVREAHQCQVADMAVRLLVFLLAAADTPLPLVRLLATIEGSLVRNTTRVRLNTAVVAVADIRPTTVLRLCRQHSSSIMGP